MNTTRDLNRCVKCEEKVQLFDSCDCIIYNGDDELIADVVAQKCGNVDKLAWSRSNREARLYVSSVETSLSLVMITRKPLCFKKSFSVSAIFKFMSFSTVPSAATAPPSNPPWPASSIITCCSFTVAQAVIYSYPVAKAVLSIARDKTTANITAIFLLKITLSLQSLLF